MKESIIVGLTRPARKEGGDRYENKEGTFVIYVPQYISRKDAKQPVEVLTVTFEAA